MNVTDMFERGSLRPAILRRPLQFQGLLMIFERLLSLSQRTENHPHAVKRNSFPAPVANSPLHRERLIVVLESFRHPALRSMHIRRKIICSGFSAEVACSVL